ncbi:MAG: hypothetical protein U0V48_00700 [Anaerolineales bacterium]
MTAILAATAESLGVRDELYNNGRTIWVLVNRQTAERRASMRRRECSKARACWEIASMFEDAGLPSGSYKAAAECLSSHGGSKNAPEMPKLEEVLEALRK